MTTQELINKLKEIDPSGNTPIRLMYDGLPEGISNVYYHSVYPSDSGWEKWSKPGEEMDKEKTNVIVIE